MKMEFRRIEAEDAKVTFACRIRALELEPTAFLTTVEEEMSRGIAFLEKILSIKTHDNVIFGTFADNMVIGIVGILTSNKSKIRHRATIWGMFVEPEKRNKGIGGKLLDLAILHARENMHVELINLSVESTNQKAIRLYKSRGFECWGIEPKSMLYQGRYYAEAHFLLNLKGEDKDCYHAEKTRSFIK